MKPGRKPIPTQLKLLTGNPGKQKLNKQITLDDCDMPECPKHLESYARDEWNRLVGGLYNTGLLHESSVQSFAAYCASYSRWRHAEEELNKLRNENSELAALILKHPNGGYSKQPLITISNAAARDMVRFAEQFGLTPSALSRLTMEPRGGKKSKFDGLIGANGKG